MCVRMPSASSVRFFFFFFMILPRPRSTLFPYTTLFRSDIKRDMFVRSFMNWSNMFTRLMPRTIAGRKLDREHVGPIDRKSTRLNSSHVAISYAVFCLKKKTELDLVLWLEESVAHVGHRI